MHAFRFGLILAEFSVDFFGQIQIYMTNYELTRVQERIGPMQQFVLPMIIYCELLDLGRLHHWMSGFLSPAQQEKGVLEGRNRSRVASHMAPHEATLPDAV